MAQWVCFLAIFGTILVVGCKEEPTEVEITQTRELTSKDRDPKLFPTSSERFEGKAQAGGSVKGSVPAGWKRVEGSSMRLLNFVVGAQGEAQAYLSKSRGDVPSNVARWMGQFGVSDSSPEKVAAMPKAKLGPLEGVLVEAEGNFSPGMGRPEQEDQALLGIIAEQGGVIWTLKMTGPKEILAEQRETFLAFGQSLDLPE
jgi:hypothetical protein